MTKLQKTELLTVLLLHLPPWLGLFEEVKCLLCPGRVSPNVPMLEIESTKSYANGVWWCDLWEEIRIRWDRESGALMLSVPLKQKGPKQAGLLFLTIWCPLPHHGTARRSSETQSIMYVPGLPNIHNYELITAIFQELASPRKSMRILIL